MDGPTPSLPSQPEAPRSARAADPAASQHCDFHLDPRTYDRALSCVHCGLCLPACPTYTETGHEADSPRGRIQLMRGLADGALEATPAVRRHLDLCLDCRACETACPSGVVYHELIEETRTRFAEQEHKPGGARPTLEGRVMRWLFFHIFTHPARLKLALLPVRIMQKFGLYSLLRKTGIFRLLPMGLRKMEQMLPAGGSLWTTSLPARTLPAGGRPSSLSPVLRGEGRGEGSSVKDSQSLESSFHPSPRPSPLSTGEREPECVAFFAGCIGSVLFGRVNRQAMELLAAAGAEVTAPPPQVCCGAIHHHNGAHAAAQAFARRNIDAFLPLSGPQPEFITTPIAGCGAMLREYDVLLRDDPAYADRARAFAARVRDISELLVALGLPTRSDLLKYVIDRTVTYHDACHLAHAQRVTAAPRELLRAIPGLKLVPLAESDMCCGAAGTYNLTEPAMATQLAARKLGHIAATGAPICVAGNVGCAMQIQSEADARGQKLSVVHPVELLHGAVFGVDCRSSTA